MSHEALERSRSLLARGKSGEAVLLLRQALAQGGGPALHAMLGYALYHGGHIAEARSVLANGVERFPYDPGVQEAFARIQWMDGAGVAFADSFIAAVEGRPGDLPLRFKCAEVLRLAGDAPRCEALLRDGLARHPGHPNLLATLGVLLDETGRLDEALQANRSVAQAFPDVAVLQLNLAHTLMRKEQAEDALKILTTLRAREPGLQLAITYEAMALKQLGDARHGWLCDYERHVQACDLAAPAGFSSVAAFNEELAAALRGMMDAFHHPLEQSLRGGSQTSDNLIHSDHPLLRAYFAALEEPIRAFIAAIGVEPGHPLWRDPAGRPTLSGCWSVLLRPNGFHVNHTHPNGWLSSSYYVSLPASVNADSHDGWIKFGEPRWPIPGCGVERMVQPKEGRLVLFPSYMWHGTIPFPSGERLTAPFDVVSA